MDGGREGEKVEKSDNGCKSEGKRGNEGKRVTLDGGCERKMGKRGEK